MNSTKWLVILMIDESELPENWKIEKMEDICGYIQRGKQPEYDDDNGEVGIINQRCIYWDKFDMSSVRYLDTSDEQSWQDYRYLQDGDVLLTSTGDGTLGRANVWTSENRKDYVVDGHVTILRSDKSKVTPKYLYYFLRSPYGQDQIFRYERGATGQTELYKGYIIDIEVIIPPLDEQERIVEAVEERLGRVERLDKSVENVGRLADEYQDSYKSYLSSGIDVKSSEVLKGIPEEDSLPDGWNLLSLSEVADINPRSSYDELDEYAYVPMDAVSAETQSVERFDRRDSTYSSLARFEKGDILFARITPCFENGKIAVVPELPEGYNFAVGSSEFAVIRPKDIDTDYLHMYLTSPVVKEWGENRLVGATGRERIQVTQIRNELSVPVPPMEKQKEIVSEVRRTDFSKVSKAVSDLDNHFDEYRRSVLAHAFKGDIDY